MGCWEHCLLCLVALVAACFSCPSGTYLSEDDNRCYYCPAGYYEQEGSCSPCPLDQYSTAEAQTACQACPNDTNTLETGADSADDCLEVVCEIPSTTYAVYRVATTAQFYAVSSGTRVAGNTSLVFVCSAGYRYENTDTNTQERRCGDGLNLPTYCIRVEASQDGEGYLISSSTVNVTCDVDPYLADYSTVYFYNNQTYQTSATLDEGSGSVSIMVDSDGIWECNLAQIYDSSSNTAVTQATISSLVLTLSKPAEIATSLSDDYRISCTASYLDAMSLPDVGLYLDDTLVSPVISSTGSDTYKITKTYSKPDYAIAGTYKCVSSWSITDGIQTAEEEEQINFLGLTSTYPAQVDGTASETVLVASGTQIELSCDTYTIAGGSATIAFYVNGELDGSSTGNSITVMSDSGATTVYCEATYGGQTVISNTTTLLTLDVTIDLYPSEIYGSVDDNVAITCSVTSSSIEQAVLVTYEDGTEMTTTQTSTVDSNMEAVFAITIEERKMWAKCGVYVSTEGLYFYSSPQRVYYRATEIDPDYLVLLAGTSGYYTLTVFGDPSDVSLANIGPNITHDSDLSNDWMNKYNVSVTAAETSWNGTLQFSVDYSPEIDTQTAVLYVIDVSVAAYSENIAEGQDISLTCSHAVSPLVLEDPLVTWSFTGADSAAEQRVTLNQTDSVMFSSGRDKSTLTVSGVNDEDDSGNYTCSVTFSDKNTATVVFSKWASVRQKVVGEAFFSALPAVTGASVDTEAAISCTAQYSPPTASQDPVIGVECQDNGNSAFLDKTSTSFDAATTTDFTKEFSVTITESMNNMECRCYGTFYDADNVHYRISSPLTRMYAHAVTRTVNFNHYSMIGHSVTFSCAANGDNSDGAIPIKWKHEEDEVEEGITAGDTIEGVYSSTLLLHNITQHSNGTYSCYVDYPDQQHYKQLNLVVLHIEVFASSTLYKSVNTDVTLTCAGTQRGGNVPQITWTHDGETSACDSSAEEDSRLYCLKTVTVTTDAGHEALTTQLSCSLSYPAQSALLGQEEDSAALTIVTQDVWSNQDKVTVVEGGSASYTCKVSGDRAQLSASIDYPGNPTPTTSDSGDYIKEFTFYLEDIETQTEYTCTGDFGGDDTALTTTVQVYVMALTEELPTLTFETLGFAQTFTCTFNLMGDSTTAQISWDGGEGADSTTFNYFDTEGEATSILELNPVKVNMTMNTYTCSVVISGSDGDNTLTSSGQFVVQYVSLPKSRYYGVEGEALAVPCTGKGEQVQVQALHWTGPAGAPASFHNGGFVADSYSSGAVLSASLVSTLSETLESASNGTYTCAANFSNPHNETLELTVLKIEKQPDEVVFLKMSSTASLTCEGTAPTQALKPAFTWEYVDAINTGLQDTCGAQYNPLSSGTLETATDSMGTSVLEHVVLEADHLRAVACTLTWAGTDADGQLTTTSSRIVRTFIESEDEKFIVEGKAGTLTCTVYGPSDMAVTWYKENLALSEDLYTTQRVDACYRSSSTLTIVSADASSEGSYTCFVNATQQSEELSHQIQLKVYRIIEFVSADSAGVSATTITQYDTASLACIASYSGGTFSFVRVGSDNIEVPQTSNYEVETDDGIAAGWNINSFEEEDAAEYKCVVTWDDQSPPVEQLTLDISLVCEVPDISNGILVTDDPTAVYLREGEQGTVSCTDGYTLSGDSSVRCTGGQLLTTTDTNLTSTCQQVPNERCVVLPVPANGKLVCWTAGSDLVCQVECNEGYLVASEETYTCSDDEEPWSHVTSDNPSAKTATCNEISAADFTFTLADSCSGLTCGTDCPFSSFTCNGNIVTLSSTLNTDAATAALEALDASRQRRQTRSITVQEVVQACQDGAAENEGYCVMCGVGYYEVSDACSPCLQGTYSNEAGRTECNSCPAGTNTVGTKAASLAECIEVCEVAVVTNGSPYPPAGYTVAAGANVTLSCSLTHSLEYKQNSVVTCADTLPTCWSRCTITSPDPSYNDKGLKLVKIGTTGEYIDSSQTPAALCSSPSNPDIQCSSSSGTPEIAHGYPIIAVCDDSKATSQGNANQTLYCQDGAPFEYPECTCDVRCGDGYWQCMDDCSCITSSKRCDGVDDCSFSNAKPEESDEYDCPVENENPRGIQFDHWQDASYGGSVNHQYSQDEDWTTFGACFWIQTSYLDDETVFSYGGRVEVTVGDGTLTAYFKFQGDSLGSSFTNAAPDINNGDYHSICVTWSSVGGAVDVYYDKVDLIEDEEFQTWSVSGKVLPSSSSLALKIGSNAEEGQLFHGFVKDLLIIQKYLIEEDLNWYVDDCLFPAYDSTRITWATLMDSVEQARYTMEYSGTCSSPACTGSCPVDMFMCENTCDCISAWQRCDKTTQHCIDNTDESEEDCKPTNGVFTAYTEQTTFTASNDQCIGLGGYLASINSAFENSYGSMILTIDSIRTAWIGMNVADGVASDYWVSGELKTAYAQDHYTEDSRVTTDVGLKNDGDWIAVYGLFSDKLPLLCKTQGYLVAKLDEKDSPERTCDQDGGLQEFPLADDYFKDIAADILSSRASMITGWKGAAWAKSDLSCPYLDSSGSDPPSCEEYWNLPSLCGVQVELEQVTQAKMTGSDSSFFQWDNPWLGKGSTAELSICFNVKTAGSGTVLRYSSGDYENEILVYLSKNTEHTSLDILELAYHNRVNFFSVKLMDGVWHSVCAAWQTATANVTTGTIQLVVDGLDHAEEDGPAGLSTQATWPTNLYEAQLSDEGSLYLGRQGVFGSADGHTRFTGSLMNLNIWGRALSLEQMEQMTREEGSFKCGPIVVQERDIFVRWRDLLHFSSSDVEITTTKDHPYCGILYSESTFTAVGGSSSIITQLKKSTNSTAVRYGDAVRVLSEDSLQVSCHVGNQSCSWETCPTNSTEENCGSQFTVLSLVWEIGRAVALRDQIYLQLQDTQYTLNTGLSALEDSITTTTVTVDAVGWVDPDNITGDCTDCTRNRTRTCMPPDEYCIGPATIAEPCPCTHESPCVEEPESNSNYSGTYNWQYYLADQFYAICPYGSFPDRYLPLVIVADCTNATMYDNETCSFESEAAQALYKILYLSDPITDDNVAEIALQTSEAVSAADDLSAVHVELAADIVSSISSTTNISEAVATNVMEVFDTLTISVSDEDITASSEGTSAPQKLVDSVEEAVQKMTTPENSTSVTIKKETIGISVLDIPDDQDESVQFSVTRFTGQSISDAAFTLDNETDAPSNNTLERRRKRSERRARREAGNSTATNSTGGDEEDEEENTVSITIASDVARLAKRLSFMVFQSSKMFVATQDPVLQVNAPINDPFATGTLSIQSSILGGSVNEDSANATSVGSTRTEPAAVMTLTTEGGVDKQRTPYCVYWDDTSQMWSETGLQITSCDSSSISCSSDHLTNFAVLMNIGNNTFSDANILAMEILTYTGCSLSILCLVLTVVGLAIGKMRKNPTYHIHLCLAGTLAFAMFSFLVGVDRTEHWLVCKICAVVIHYSFLAAICWMLVEGVNLYVALIIVFGVNHKKMKIAAHCFAWGVPALICTVTVVVDKFVDGIELYEICMTAKYCFLNHTGRMYFFVAPVLLMLTINLFIFVRVIIVLAKATKNRDRWTDLRQISVLAAITGVGWVLGAFTVGGSVGTLIVNYVYIILNAFQGIVIFYFHCFGKPDVKKAWSEKLSTTTSKIGTSSNSAGTGLGKVLVQKARPISEVAAKKRASGLPLTDAEKAVLEGTGTVGRKVSTQDSRYSTTVQPRYSTVSQPGQPGRVSTNVNPNIGPAGRGRARGFGPRGSSLHGPGVRGVSLHGSGGRGMGLHGHAAGPRMSYHGQMPRKPAQPADKFIEEEDIHKDIDPSAFNLASEGNLIELEKRGLVEDVLYEELDADRVVVPRPEYSTNIEEEAYASLPDMVVARASAGEKDVSRPRRRRRGIDAAASGPLPAGALETARAGTSAGRVVENQYVSLDPTKKQGVELKALTALPAVSRAVRAQSKRKQSHLGYSGGSIYFEPEDKEDRV